MQREVWSDLDHRLIADAQGALKKVINIEAVKTSIYNILGTRRGERVMVPSFASRFGGFVFENITPEMVNLLADEVKDVIVRWDDRVEVVAVDFNAVPDKNMIDISVEFRILGYENIFNLDFRLGGDNG